MSFFGKDIIFENYLKKAQKEIRYAKGCYNSAVGHRMVCDMAWKPFFCLDTDETGQKLKLDVPYEPTSYGITKAMLSMAKVTSKDLVYDLGCGDGRIVIMAAKEQKHAVLV